MDAHSFAARKFAHLYAVGDRQHSMGAVVEMQGTVQILRRILEKKGGNNIVINI